MTALCFAKDFEEYGEEFYEEGSVIRVFELLGAGAPGHTPQCDGIGKSETALGMLQGMVVGARGKVKEERDGLIALLQECVVS